MTQEREVSAYMRQWWAAFEADPRNRTTSELSKELREYSRLSPQAREAIGDRLVLVLRAADKAERSTRNHIIPDELRAYLHRFLRAARTGS